MLIPLLHHHLFCFPVCGCLVLWSSAICRLLLGRTSADLTVFSLADLKPFTGTHYIGTLFTAEGCRALCPAPRRHLAVTSCPRAGLSGTLRGSRVYLLVSQILPTSLSTTLSPPDFTCFSFTSLPPYCFQLVYIFNRSKVPELSLRESSP